MKPTKDDKRFILAGVAVSEKEAYELLEMYSDNEICVLLCSGAISTELFLRMRIYLLNRINKNARLR